MGTGSFPGVKSSRGVILTPHPLLVPWSWKGRAIPLLPLWAVWPVQSLSACTFYIFWDQLLNMCTELIPILFNKPDVFSPVSQCVHNLSVEF